MQAVDRSEHLVQVPVAALRPGMYVAELDRPWLETPFAIQGFLLRSSSDIELLTEYCTTVQVCPRRSSIAMAVPRSSAAGGPARARTPATPAPPVAKTSAPVRAASGSVGLKSEFVRARGDFESAKDVVSGVFDQLRSGGALNLPKMRDALEPVIQGVLRDDTTMAILARVKQHSDYAYGHCIACAVWATIIGRHLALEGDALRNLALGCALIDVGMAQLPQQILKKPGPLTPAETALVSSHVERGLAMLEQSGLENRDVLNIVAYHHERWDGSGYPHAAAGRKIPLLARIAAMVDAYDAMITQRPWAPARSSFEAIQELQDLAGTQFQPELVDQFTAAIGLFPTGAIVELSSGEVGIVTRQNPARRLRPEIVLVLNADKTRRSDYETLDLMADAPAGDGVPARWIRRELPRGAYDINAEDFYL